ncbi:MAG: hypothetical protein D8M59_02570 [Planctomycetes bacterium]|nr:hypothetical protein [Planctomycetota bacterium]NOG54394.1 hypothetical protein [Planctomycetota bacterium]
MKLGTKRGVLVLGGLALAILISLSAGVQTATADVVKLKSGKTYECEIVEEHDDWIQIRITIGSIVQDYTLIRSDIESITRAKDADPGGGDKDPEIRSGTGSTGTGAEVDKTALPSDLVNKKVYVIPLREMVGQYLRADKLEEAIDAARPYEPDVIILEIDSPGGLLSEIYVIRDYLSEVRDEFRIVTWIKSAISAAAMTSFNTRELYFKSDGHVGAATAFSPATGKAIEGLELELWLDYARTMFEDAGYSPYIAQAMIAEKYWLSADREILDNGDIKVTWYNDDSGEHVLSRPGENLVLTADQAEYFDLSGGTADTNEEFAKLLHLDGWVEVSDEGRKIMENWFATVERADKEIPTLFRQLGLYSDGTRGSLTKQIQIYKELIKWCDRLGEEVAGIFYGLQKEQLELQLQQLIRALRGG